MKREQPRWVTPASFVLAGALTLAVVPSFGHAIDTEARAYDKNHPVPTSIDIGTPLTATSIPSLTQVCENAGMINCKVTIRPDGSSFVEGDWPPCDDPSLPCYDATTECDPHCGELPKTT